MKNIFYLLLISLLFSCGGLKKMQERQAEIKYVLTPKVLEMHGDSVDVGITANFPKKYFNKKATVIATPILKYESGQANLKSITLDGEKVRKGNKIVRYSDGGSIVYQYKMPFTNAMKVSDLVLDIKASMGAKTVDFETANIGKGVISTPLLATPDAKYKYADIEIKNEAENKVSADINYVVSQSVIRESELKQDDIKQLQEKIKNESNTAMTEISILSYASPEGAERMNEGLADNRGKAAKEFVMEELAKNKIKLDDKIFKILNTPEDWVGFKSLMEKSDIKDKELVLRVLSMYSDPDQREMEIRKMASVYDRIDKEILPQLRMSNITINYGGTSVRTEAEIMQIANSGKIEQLNMNELLILASKTDNKPMRMGVYKVYSLENTNDWRGFNNLGCSLAEQGLLRESEVEFKKAQNIDNNEIINSNLAIVCLLQNKTEEAQEYLKNVKNKEEIMGTGYNYIKKAKYQNAIDYYKNECSFNNALVRILTKDYNKAIELINCSANKEDGMFYYLKAIIGARQKDSNMMYSDLKKAIEKDSKIKNTARQDMEFYGYRDSEEFKNIVK